jgi:Flp pilus assembly protein TadG
VAEFAIVVLLMLTLVMGLIDFSRAIYATEVIENLTREGSNLAAKGTDVTTTAAAMISQSDLGDMSTQGRVFVTQVQDNNGQYIITGQGTAGSYAASSKVGSTIGNPAVIPASAKGMVVTSHDIYVTEVYYQFQPCTPVGQLLNLAMPSSMYDIAFF